MKARLLVDYPLFGFIVAEAGTVVTIDDDNPTISPVEVIVKLWEGDDFMDYPFFVHLDDLEIIEDDE